MKNISFLSFLFLTALLHVLLSFLGDPSKKASPKKISSAKQMIRYIPQEKKIISSSAFSNIKERMPIKKNLSSSPQIAPNSPKHFSKISSGSTSKRDPYAYEYRENKTSKSLPVIDSSISGMITNPMGAKVDLVVPKEFQNVYEIERFTGFRARLIGSYLQNLILTLRDYQSRFPHLNFPYTSSSEYLRALVIYDKEGNIVKIETLKSSESEKLQDFFLDALGKMDKVPHIPNQLYDQNGYQRVYFGLDIIY